MQFSKFMECQYSEQRKHFAGKRKQCQLSICLNYKRSQIFLIMNNLNITLILLTSVWPWPFHYWFDLNQNMTCTLLYDLDLTLILTFSKLFLHFSKTLTLLWPWYWPHIDLWPPQSPDEEYSPSVSLETENSDLLKRLGDVQQEKWMLEEKVNKHKQNVHNTNKRGDQRDGTNWHLDYTTE